MELGCWCAATAAKWKRGTTGTVDCPVHGVRTLPAEWKPGDEPFEPSARQLELMEHAVGGDRRYRNYFLAASENIAEWRALAVAGLAIEAAAPVKGAENIGLARETIAFRVSPAGLALLDARARPRIAEAKARAWDTFRATFWEVFERDDEDDGTLAEFAKTFITDWERANRGGTPAPKGPRAIAEEIVRYVTDDANSGVDGIAEIIRKALGGES